MNEKSYQRLSGTDLFGIESSSSGKREEASKPFLPLEIGYFLVNPSGNSL
jgi:hypothetical protein